MRRHLVPLLLLLWGVAIALGCTWTLVWLLLLIPAGAVQAAATIRLYRDHHRRLW